MVIPACARTSLSPSSNSLISSSIFSGTFPVLGSMPIRPARYSVSPKTIPSLKGAFTNLFGSLIALRSNCPDDCEYALCNVRLPAINSATRTIPIRRFMAQAPSQRNLVERLCCGCTECSAGRLRAASRNAQCLPPQLESESFEMRLQRDQPDPNEIQRRNSDHNPKQYTSLHRTPANFI